ncbi:Mitochondrial transcription termination factor family protein [Striga hermonthica]|uniref:Mitochondrial transcription termination factor family protein n=1 Tax=Striga hermonthica TaxID=68872 RepID=A0A9N7RFV4_STRHE|nr:Mitochondrial transcription termination factor family protein [Striga hermonthica]
MCLATSRTLLMLDRFCSCSATLVSCCLNNADNLRARFRFVEDDSNLPPELSILVGRQFRASENAVFSKPFTTGKLPPGVRENDPEKSFTFSYLVSSCGLAPDVAVRASSKIQLKSPEKPDAVLNLPREYGFTATDISVMVTRWPNVLCACPDKILLPKLEFFASIGVPLPLLASSLSRIPYVLWHNLKNSIIPSYDFLKNGLHSNDLRLKKLSSCMDRAIEMGFDVSNNAFSKAIRVLVGFDEWTLKRKMEVYRKCGWSEYDIRTAFLSQPLCMALSEKKILVSMGFLVDKLGWAPGDVARCSWIIGYSLERRMKPCVVPHLVGLPQELDSGAISIVTPAGNNTETQNPAQCRLNFFTNRQGLCTKTDDSSKSSHNIDVHGGQRRRRLCVVREERRCEADVQRAKV